MYMLYVCGYVVARVVFIVWVLVAMDLLGYKIVHGGGYIRVAYVATV